MRLDQMSFLRKVLGIVGFQLTLTVVIILASSYSYSFGSFCTSIGCFITCWFLYLFSLLALFCSKNLRHSVPMNYIVLTIFTLSMAFMVAGLTAWLSPMSVLMAVGTLAIVLSTLFFAMLATPNKPKAVLGVILGILAACILQLIIMIPLCIAGAFEGIYIMYCIFGVLISSGLIYIDLFLVMMAGSVACDEYILAAVMLYIDIIRLLFYLLMIFASK